MTSRRRHSMNMHRFGIVVLLAAGLSACTIVHTPAPVLPARNTIMAGESITVQGNQNVYAIARAHNVSMREIIVLNNLQPPFALKSGQELILPAGGTSLAGDMSSVPVSSAPIASSSAVEKVELAPLAPPPVSSSSIMPAPLGASPVDALNAPSVPPKPVATTVKPAVNAQIVTANPQPVTPPVVSPSSAPVAAAGAPVEASPTKVTMVWPLQGPILSSFGDKGTGVANDGINIGAPKGSPVVAATGGTVVYVGNEMKGFGNLILIRHEGGWVTAYAHLDRTLVGKDSIVAQGDMIGTVGKTGNVSSPQLHFETRHEGKPVDPRTQISG